MKNRTQLLGLLLAAIGGLVLALGFHRLALALVRDINSDTLFLAQFADDATHGMPLTNWVLQPAPSFFPDGLVVGLARLVTRDIRSAMYVYHTLFLGILLTAFAGVAHKLTRDWAWAAIVTLAPALQLVFETTRSPMASNFFLPGHHGMSTAMAILSLAVVLATDRQRDVSTPRLLVFSVVQVATAGCDKLYILIGILPLAAMLIAGWLGRALRRNVVLAFLAGCVIAVPAPMVVETLLRRAGMFIPEAPSTVDWSLGRVVAAVDMLNVHATTHPVFAWSFALFMLIGPAVAAGAFVKRRMAPTHGTAGALALIATFMSAVVLANVLGVAFGGFLVDPYRVRYLEAVWVIPPFALAMFAQAIGPASPLWRAAVPTALLALSIQRTRNDELPPVPAKTIGTYAPSTQCIDAAAHETGLRVGYATYWHGRKEGLLSHEHVRFAQITADFRVHQWITNLGYHQLVAGSEAGFLVYLADADESAIRRALGDPAEARACGTAKLFVYRGPPRALPTGVVNARMLTPATLQW
jgi:hypothetical protein